MKNALWLQALRVASKAIRYSRGGFTKKEKKDLAQDLLELAELLLSALTDELTNDPPR